MTEGRKMRAMAWSNEGQVAQIAEVDAPVPARGEVRVAVHSSAVNPADAKVVGGGLVGRVLHAKTSPLIVGYDFSGTIDECGVGVTDFEVGDEVFGFLAYSSSTRQGAFAERVTIDAGAIGRKPDSVSHEVAAAAATPALTALQCLRDLGRLEAGGRVLLIGAAGGVGSLGVGVAKRLGATVVAVCSSYAVDFVRELGADDVIDRTKQDTLEVPGPFDVVFDAAAAHGYFACKHQLAPRGAYVTTLPSPGVFAGKLAALLSSRRCEFVAVKSRAADLELVAGWLADTMAVPIAERFSVRDVKAALDALAKGRLLGRLAVQVEGDF
jgi:NADPH:quinone reductase-like Zn-dependent oxidoreductase